LLQLGVRSFEKAATEQQQVAALLQLRKGPKLGLDVLRLSSTLNESGQSALMLFRSLKFTACALIIEVLSDVIKPAKPVIDIVLAKG
jgi:hypothetical protein